MKNISESVDGRDFEVTSFYHQESLPDQAQLAAAICPGCWCSGACLPACVFYWSVSDASADVYSASSTLGSALG